MLPSRTDEYSDVIQTADRFMERDIDAMVELQLERKERNADELLMERGLGQLQLNVLRKMLEQEAETVSKLPTSTSAEAQFLLGKEDGLKRAQSVLDDLMSKTNTLYK